MAASETGKAAGGRAEDRADDPGAGLGGHRSPAAGATPSAQDSEAMSGPQPQQPASRQALREALGSFATGIAIVTTIDKAGTPVGLTVNSFSSVSMEPPLVLFCLDRRAYSLPAFQEAGYFAANILSEDQSALSQRFATPHLDRWGGLEWVPGTTGVPLLPGCVARIECRRHSLVEGGDHQILLGEVIGVQSDPEGRALVYQRGRYGRFRGHD